MWKIYNAAGRPDTYSALPSYLPLALVSSRIDKYEVVFRTTTTIPILILRLETISSSSTRYRKVKWEEISSDVTENVHKVATSSP
jgi:hypothetical protein